MKTYMKKQITVKAEQWDGFEHPLVHTGNGFATILGKQGHAFIYPGDWIIEEPDGSGHYPCNPEVFAQTYDLVG